MRLHALVLHGTGGASHEFTPDGDGTWLLELHGGRGTGPGGRWQTSDLLVHVIDAVDETERAAA